MVFSLHKNTNNEYGQTLIEVIFGLLILCLLSVSFLGIYPSTTLWINKARQETTAANYASAILEDLRAHRDKLEVCQSKTPDELGLNETEYKPADVIMPASIDISLFNESNSNDPRRYVTVTVNWSEGGGSRNLELSSIIRKE